MEPIIGFMTQVPPGSRWAPEKCPPLGGAQVAMASLWPLCFTSSRTGPAGTEDDSSDVGNTIIFNIPATRSTTKDCATPATITKYHQVWRKMLIQAFFMGPNIDVQSEPASTGWTLSRGSGGRRTSSNTPEITLRNLSRVGKGIFFWSSEL